MHDCPKCGELLHECKRYKEVIHKCPKCGELISDSYIKDISFLVVCNECVKKDIQQSKDNIERIRKHK